MPSAWSSEWSQALDAFEEWLRQMTAGFAARDLLLPADPPPFPSTPVPAELRVRLLAAAAHLQATERAGLKRREQLTREQAYAS